MSLDLKSKFCMLRSLQSSSGLPKSHVMHAVGFRSPSKPQSVSNLAILATAEGMSEPVRIPYTEWFKCSYCTYAELRNENGHVVERRF